MGRAARRAARLVAEGCAEVRPIPIDALPERLRVQILTDYLPKRRVRPPSREARGTPNKGEAEYNRDVLHGAGRYEAVVLRCPGGNYTPDFMTIDDGVVTFHEVKGSYRFGSESRAVLAFRSAAAAFPFFRFVWAKKSKNGGWEVKRIENDAPEDNPANHNSP